MFYWDTLLIYPVDRQYVSKEDIAFPHDFNNAFTVNLDLYQKNLNDNPRNNDIYYPTSYILHNQSKNGLLKLDIKNLRVEVQIIESGI